MEAICNNMTEVTLMKSLRFSGLFINARFKVSNILTPQNVIKIASMKKNMSKIT